MSCQNVCRLCRNLVISTAVTFDTATNTLNITIPDNGYRSGEKVCIIVAQTIPTATITALVNIVVGASTFPLIKCDCSQATACEIGSRRKYSTRIVTNTVSGSFRLLAPINCIKPDNLSVLPVTAVTPTVNALRNTTKSKKEGAIDE